jgi:hypothetical protein
MMLGCLDPNFSSKRKKERNIYIYIYIYPCLVPGLRGYLFAKGGLGFPRMYGGCCLWRDLVPKGQKCGYEEE